MRRLLRVLAGALVFTGCASEPGAPNDLGGMDAGPACFDQDNDGFGRGCPLGFDCDDRNPNTTNQCRACAHPEAGCACKAGTQPIACFLPDRTMPDGNVMCSEGTRSCRDGLWSACEDVHTYVVIPDPTVTSEIDPSAAPTNCSPCDLKCFVVHDPLLASDAGIPGSGVTYAGGEGITLGPGDGGSGDGGTGGDGGLGGCAGLTTCCDRLSGVPQLQQQCTAFATDPVNDDADCDIALRYYCPDVISGPIQGCTIGGTSIDSDCDGIPDELDECTPATVASNPACNGSVLPLPSTNNQAIFHVLDKGETGRNSLEIAFQVQNADVYFLMDMSNTMSEERDALVNSMTTGNVVECALLKNCCDRSGLSMSQQQGCQNVVDADNNGNCRNAQPQYCCPSPMDCHNQLLDCPDVDFDGLPNNELKNQGVVGAVRCMVGSSYFGAGSFIELPFRDGVNYSGQGGIDTQGFRDRGNTDERAFKHYVDMTDDVARVSSAIQGFTTNRNYDFPEAPMIALYSLLTGKGHMFGHNSVSVPERLGLGCPANTFGYPCFRNDTIPIIVLFTDDPMNNGPPTYVPPSGQSQALYDINYNLNGKLPTSGLVRYTPVQAETFGTAYNVGDVRDQFVGLAGNTRYMAGDYPVAITGCGAEAGAPEAIYRFTVSGAAPTNVKFAMNVALDPNPPTGPGTYTYGSAENKMTPATEFPVVLTLYRGIPATVQPPTNVGETRINPIPSGPDLAYLTYIGTSAGPTESAPGFLGGISGCGADGATNEVVFTFRPIVNAKIVIDASQTGFGTAVSLHDGLPQTLPANPSTLGVDKVVLSGSSNNNDTFATARRVDGADSKIDGDYVTYVGDTISLQDSGSGSSYNAQAGKAGRDDYDDNVVACGVNPAGPDAVFRFDVQTPRRVRIDTEGSNFQTVLSLHDDAPPQSFDGLVSTLNDEVIDAYRVGTQSGDSVTNAAYAVESNPGGTGALITPADALAPSCGTTSTMGSKDAYFSFRLSRATRLSISARGGPTAMGNEAVNTPGTTNLTAAGNAPPATPGTDAVINEFVLDHVGTDSREFFEIFGQPQFTYPNYYILEVEGDDGENIGDVDRVIAVGPTDAAGLWVSPYSSSTDDGTRTLLLVEGWTGMVFDLDTDNMNGLDPPPAPPMPIPFTRIVDSVAILDGNDVDDATYGFPVLLSTHGGGSTPVGGASRIPSGRNTGADSDWARNDFDGEGLPGIGFDPAVFLYASPPGSVTKVNAADPNGDSDTSDSNSHDTATSALDLGDIFGQVDTEVENADLSHPNTHDDLPSAVVPCLMPPVAARDHVYKFTPSQNGTGRVEVQRKAGSHNHVVAIYDDPPPLSGGPTSPYQLFDASLVTPAPDSSCTAWSRGGHIYWMCANGRTWFEAETRCNVAGSHLLRVDDVNENTFSANLRGSTSTQAWIGGRDTSASGTRTWFWNDTYADQFWSGGSTGSPVGGRYANWRSGEPSSTSEDCAAYFYGAGADYTRWADRACSTGYHYVCEHETPSPVPPESQATAYPVGNDFGLNGDMVGRILYYRGSTRRMESNIDGLLMSACGATQNAPDAVFEIRPSSNINVDIDTTGSSFPAIVGLFDTTIDATGYQGCDAPGSTPLSDMLVGGRTYYAVIKGTAASPDGTYQIKFTDTGAADDDGLRLACAVETGTVAAMAEADFYANHTYYVVVENNQSMGDDYTMKVHSLYQTRAEFENPQALNEHASSAFELIDPYRSKATVQNTSTGGMAANYTVGMMGPLTCGSDSAAPDAVYSFTPSIDTRVKISTSMTAPKASVVALFRGQPASLPTTTPIDDTNEDTDTAYVVNMSGAAQTLLGDTSMMQNDIAGALLSCGAAPLGRDAVFKFSLAQPTTVEIDASASTGGTMMGDPVIALFNDYALERPPSTTLENDTYTEANVNPTPTPTATASWLVYDADMANLTPANQAQLNVMASNTNEQVNPATLDGAQVLGDVWNTKITVNGATTAMMQPDYPAMTCGGDPDSPDAIYEFYSSQSGEVRISTAAPPPGFNTVIELYSAGCPGLTPCCASLTGSDQTTCMTVQGAGDHSNCDLAFATYCPSMPRGVPARKSDTATTTIDLSGVGCGNGVVDFVEECDDGNTLGGDGCDGNCQFESGWRCAGGQNAGDGCDCGCGEPDMDCISSSAADCNWFLGLNRCDPIFDGSMLMPAANHLCMPANGVWRCLPSRYNDGECNCGCGAIDPDCATPLVASCDQCDDPFVTSDCGSGACPGNIDPLDNGKCTGIIPAGNLNDTIANAALVNLAGGGLRRFIGNTSGLQQNVPPAQVGCGASAMAPDSIFEFSLKRSTLVQIDASASTNSPVIALFDSGALNDPPSYVLVENDDAAAADLNPNPTPNISGTWVRYEGDLANFTISTQPQTHVSNQDNVNNDAATGLYDPMNRRVTVINADTSAPTMQATFAAPSCGSVSTATDALYRFVPESQGQVRISTAYPDTALNNVIAIYDGSGGKLPLRNADLTSVTQGLGTTHESQASAHPVPIEGSPTRIYTGSTVAMTSDVDPNLLGCGAAAAGDAVFSFSLAGPMDVEIDAAGSGFNTVLGLFDSPFVRPSISERRSLAAARVQLYDPSQLPDQPETGCTPFDFNLHRYWFCTTKRPWDGALEKCELAGHTLVAIDSAPENAEVFSRVAPTGESHHIGLRQPLPYQSWGTSPAGEWANGSTATYRNFVAGEPNQSENVGARMRFENDANAGRWVDVPSSYQLYRYICEQSTQPALPAPPTATTPETVDLFGARRRFVGSTTGTASSLSGVIQCSALGTAPDAAFRIVVPYTTTATIDFTGSFAGSVIGLFRDSISATGYTAAGSVCARVTDPAPQVNRVLTAGTYYVVLTGSTGATSGNYDITFAGVTTDPAAFTLENDTVADAIANPFGPIENQWITKTANMANLTTDLITSRIVDMPGVDNNSSHVAPYAVRDLGDTAGQQVTVINASTAGLSDDYPAPSCGIDDDTADAIYQFTPTTSGQVRVYVTPDAHDAVIALYDGSNGEYPLLKGAMTNPPVTVPNTNEAPTPASAYAVTVGDPVTYVGNISAMVNHVPTVDASGRPWDRRDLLGGDAGNLCSAAATGRDAFFTFTLPSTTTVVMSSIGTDFGHTLALFDTAPLTAPAPTTAEYNTRGAAPNLAIDGQWYELQGDTTNLTPGGDVRVTRTAGSDFQNDDPIQDLGTLSANTQIVTSGADTSAAPVDADYLRECGASDAADDMIFRFHSGATPQNVHIGVSNPSPSFPVVLQLWDGTNGDPQTSSEIDPTPTPVTGNETRATAYNVTLGALPVSFSGDTASFASDSQSSVLYDRSTNWGGDSANLCNAGSATKDAFFRFTLATPARVRAQVAGDATSYAHTLALYKGMPPVSQPAATPGGYDSRAAAAAGADVTIDENWVHYTTDMSTMSVDGLTAVTLSAGTQFQNASGVQDLHTAVGTITGKQYKPAPAALANTIGTGAAYPAPLCGGAAAANDMIFRVRPTAATTLRVGVDNPTPSFNPMIAVYNGVPLTTQEANFTLKDLNALGNPNENFTSAEPVLAGARARFTGNSTAMMSNYAGDQFDAFGPVCTPAATGADAFVEVEVVGIPKTARADTVLWLDAADEDYISLTGMAVTNWKDKSGLANNALQGVAARQPARQPRTNGYAIEFTPAGDTTSVDSGTEDSLLRDPAAGDSPISVFAVWKLLNTSFLSDARALSTGIPAGAAGFGLAMSADGATGTARLQYKDSGSAAVNMTAALTGATGPMLSNLTHAADGSIVTWLNGTQQATGSGRVGGTAYQRFRLGVLTDGTRALPMDLHELIVVKRVVSQSERERIEGYLAHKWGLTAGLPAGHPYKSAAPTYTVEIASANTAFQHTLSLFDAVPMSRPTATPGTAYDTSDAALMMSLGPIDDQWYVRSATTVGMTISEVTNLTRTAGTDFTNADADHHSGGVPNLGDVVGRAIKTSGASTASPVDGDYPTSTLSCSASDAASDAIFSFTSSGNTRVSVRADPIGGWSPVIGAYAGPGFPRDIASTSTTPIELDFVPSNYDHYAYAYSNAVNWSCAGTTTFNSMTGSFTGTTTCSDTSAEQPQVTCNVTQLTSGGPQVCILRFASLNIANGHTLKLIGDKPVILAVNGNATIGGIIDADGATTTPGAGGNWSCGVTSTGHDGVGSSSTGGSGGGGGGFGTKGGKGGDSTLLNRVGGAGGDPRGNANLNPLVGGCAGGLGGGCSSPIGGGGGGAFQIAARGTLTVSAGAQVRANGGTGMPGCGSEGGGTGGGSGGGLLLEGVTLSLGGTIQTNGNTGGNGANGGMGGLGSTSSGALGGDGENDSGNGGGGGGGGYGRYANGDKNNNENEAQGSAQSVSIGALATYRGRTTNMAANIAAGTFNTASKNCFAAGTPDAVFSFTLGASTPVRITTAGSSFDTALALWTSSIGAPATACDFATAAKGSVIAQTLAAGTYYVAVTGNSNTGGATSGVYKINFENTNVTGAPATPIGCASTDFQFDVTAGTTYYVLVKGATAPASGAYNLHVVDVGAIPDMSCAGDTADDAAPDAFVGFSVTNTKDVVVDLNNSMLDGVFQLYRDNGSNDILVGCAASTGSTTNIQQQLTAGSYYVKIRGTDVYNGAGERPFEISIRDDDVQRAADCADGAAGTGTMLTKTLTAGTYYVGIKPRTGQSPGAYEIAVRDTSFAQTGGSQVGCTTASSVDVGVSANTDYYVLVKGETASEKGSFGLTVTDIGAIDNTATDLGCGADLAASDAFYEFIVGDTQGASGQDVEIAITNGFNGAFQLYRDVGADSNFANDTAVSACSTSTLSYSDLTAGTYYVVAKGRSVAGGAAQQSVQLSIKDLDGVGALGCADGTSGAPASISSSSLAASLLDAQGRLLAGTYYVALSGQGAQNGAYELIFSDLDQSGSSAAALMQCTLSQELSASLAANTDYYVVVKGDGAAANGDYGLAVTDVTNVEAINAACPNDLAAPDGYAAFTLTSGPRDIRIDMSASTLDGSFQVFTNAGAPVSGCGCSALSTPRVCNLAAGTYYIVFRGDDVAGGGGEQPFKLRLLDEDALGSLDCRNGAVSSGATITSAPLAAGTYYVGIIPNSSNSSNDYDYRLMIKDAASTASGGGAQEIGCGTSSIQAPVVGGEPYYVVVKGRDPGDEGAYGLSVQDLAGVPAFGCGDDTTSGDAFYSFTVTQPNTLVTIDTEGSALETVIALFPQNADFGEDLRNNTTGVPPPDGKPDDMLACDATSGQGGRSLLSQTLPVGTYYVVVRARQGTANPNLPFNISVRDANAANAIACSATGADQARIQQTLQPGTYWVALTGSLASPPANRTGSYSLSFRDYAPIANAAPEIACGGASDTIFYDVDSSRVGKPVYVAVKGASAGAEGPYRLTVENYQLGAGMGCNADAFSPDAFYKFTLLNPTDVFIDTEGSALDTVMAVYPATETYFGTNYAVDVMGNLVNCDDDSGVGVGASLIDRRLPAGDYYLVIKGKGAASQWGAASQPFKVSIRDRSNNTPIQCATSTDPRITRQLAAGDYKLVLSDDGNGGPYDISFRDLTAINNQAVSVACEEMTDALTYTVAPNLPYYVVVKGHGAPTQSGPYTLTVESVDSGATIMGCNADPRSPDAFFRFTVTQQSAVTIDTEGSQLNTVVALYAGNATVFGTNYAEDAFGQVIGCDDEGGDGPGDSRISATLAAGNYYVVVKGANAGWGQSNLPFNLSIRDDDSTQSIQCANVAGMDTPKITRSLAAGDYTVVLSDTDGNGGAYSITFRDVNTSGQGGMQIDCGLGTIDGGDANMDGKADGLPVIGGEEYFVVVKGNTTADAGSYTLTVQDVFSSQASAGSTPIACAVEGNEISAVYPAGEYYAVVTGTGGADGDYELDIRDVDPFADYNRLACDSDSGPNGTSVIEADVEAGTHYVVVKGDGAGQSGTYKLNVRDVDAHDDRRLACANADSADRLEYNVVAGRDYTVLLKGDEALAQGDYNLKLYDELGLQSSGGQRLQCQTICPNIDPFKSGSQACTSGERMSDGFNRDLGPDTYYLSVKGRRATEKGFYELQIGDSSKGSSATKYVPPSWTETRDALIASGAKVLPVISCDPAEPTNGVRCDGTRTQAKTLAQVSGALNQAGTEGLAKYIKRDGTGLGSGLTLAVRDLANYLAMDITLSVANNPGFQINVQKCTNPLDPNQAACTAFQTGCIDTTPIPKNTITDCKPGAQPRFLVEFTNPLDPNSVPTNPNDPNGGYHFSLQLVGDNQYVLEEVPVYIIPTENMGPPPSSMGSGTFVSSGSYEQTVFGAGCNYYQLEGETSAATSCDDRVDNDSDGLVDSGIDMNGDGLYDMTGEFPPEPGCQPGSCLDSVNNDNDMNMMGQPLTDILDRECATTERQDWTDLFFKADIPVGTKIEFLMCTAETMAALSTDCSAANFSLVATVTSATGACAVNADCQNINVGGVVKDGFCGAGGQCQFIDPPKINYPCNTDAQCENGTFNGFAISSFCNQSMGQCQYTSVPAELGDHLMMGQQGQPFVRMRIMLHANTDASESPTLYDWFLTYNCIGSN